MRENVFETLLKERIDSFKASFSDTSEKVFFDQNGKLIHPGDFGRYREEECKKFLKQVIPSRLSIGQGFIINTFGHISHQCDLIIYDNSCCPPLVSTDNQFFYPVECVVAVGEVKSILSKDLFKEAIIKLSKTKVLREEIKNPSIVRRERPGEYDPIHCIYDQIFTFLICKKFDFDYYTLPAKISHMYGSVGSRHKHNLILSIEDGLLAYFDKNDKTLMYPVFRNEELKARLSIPDTNPYTHFKLFSAYMFLGTSSATILYPEITDYMGSIVGGINCDE